MDKHYQSVCRTIISAFEEFAYDHLPCSDDYFGVSKGREAVLDKECELMQEIIAISNKLRKDFGLTES